MEFLSSINSHKTYSCRNQNSWNSSSGREPKSRRNRAGLTVWPFAAFTPFIPTHASPFLSNVQLLLGVKEVQQGQLQEQGQV